MSATAASSMTAAGGAASAPDAAAATKKRDTAIGVSIFVLLLLGAGFFCMYWFWIRNLPGEYGVARPSQNIALTANEILLYQCVLGKCVPQVVNKDDPNIDANIASGIWFRTSICTPKNWKAGDPPPCQGKFKCAGVPASLAANGASSKGVALQGSLCKQVALADVAADCGANGVLCSNNDTCQAQCVASYVVCDPSAASGYRPATAADLNSATTDVMTVENAPILCNKCISSTGVALCQNGGSCNATTGQCECPPEWAGESCDVPRYGVCFAPDQACPVGDVPYAGNTFSGGCVQTDSCGPYSYAAVMCDRSKGGVATQISQACVCVSRVDVHTGAPILPDSNGEFHNLDPDNFGCYGVPGAVCKLRGDCDACGSSDNDSCTAASVSATVPACGLPACPGVGTGDVHCKNICGSDTDGVCTAAPLTGQTLTATQASDLNMFVGNATTTPPSSTPEDIVQYVCMCPTGIKFAGTACTINPPS